jgi:CO dehydrogenase maturation factor
VLTASRTAALAAELGIPEVVAVGNKARTPEDVDFFRDALAAERIELAGVLPYDLEFAAADRAGAVGLTPVAPEVRRALDEVLDALDSAHLRAAVATG